MQTNLDLGTLKIDVTKFVTFEPSVSDAIYRISGSRKTGVIVGTIRLTHSGGYEVLLRGDDGRVTSHNPVSLFPVQPPKNAG